MKFLYDFIKGIIIGIGAVAPGVSGGTFAVILGVYDTFTNAIADIFNNFRKTIIILLPLTLGVLVGIIGFSKVIKYLFEYYDVLVKLFFIGLMIGTFPSALKEANKHGFKKRYLLPCVITFSITILFLILENNAMNIILETNPGMFILAAYGIIIGFGTVMPGISSSFILIYIGAYETLLNAIVNFDLMVLIPVGLGFIFSIILFAKLINLLFKKFYGYTYYTVLGFVIGSVITLFPQAELTLEYLIGIILCFIGLCLSSFISNYKRFNKFLERYRVFKKIKNS